MHKGSHTHNREAELEADGYIGEYSRKGEEKSDHCLLSQFSPYNGADFLETDHLHSGVLYPQCIHCFLPGRFLIGADADNDSPVAVGLDNRIPLPHSRKDRPHVFNGRALFKLHLDHVASREIDAQFQSPCQHETNAEEHTDEAE